jgi:hypothetical protein
MKTVVNILPTKSGKPVYVITIPMVRYGPFQMCLSTYDKEQVPKMKEATEDFSRYIKGCYAKNNPNKLWVPN